MKKKKKKKKKNNAQSDQSLRCPHEEKRVLSSHWAHIEVYTKLTCLEKNTTIHNASISLKMSKFPKLY